MWVACSGDEAEWLDACAGGQPDEAQAASSQPSQSSMRSKELEGLSGDSDVLPVPKFVNAEGGSLALTPDAFRRLIRVHCRPSSLPFQLSAVSPSSSLWSCS